LVFELESKRQKATAPVVRRYLERWLFKVNEYMEEHQVNKLMNAGNEKTIHGNR
jgi:hypothetical protein